MTYFIPDTNDKYLIDDNLSVYSLKTETLLKPNHGFVHIYSNGCKFACKPNEFLASAKMYNKVYSKANLDDSYHIYIFDLSTCNIYHGIVPSNYDDNILNNYIKEHGFKDSEISFMISENKLNILEL